MYEELVELLRMRAALIDSDLDNQAAEAIKILEALAQNGQSAIDTNKRLADKIRMLKAKLDQAEETLDFCRTKDAEIIRLGQERNRLKRERDQAVEDLNTLRKRSDWKCEACYYNDHYNRDICTGCEYNNDNNWQWRGVQEENNG
ncbi:MAG: hypothetical protein ACLRQY_11435 [[Clostridium] leptum]|jgi:hypothetical protein|nr:MAG TPA: ubiquitin thioesterase [Caudoviricetes sp.]